MQLLPCPLLHGYPSQSVITIFQVNISIYFHCHWICEEHTLLQARRPSEVWLFGRQWFILSTPLSLVLLLTLTQTVRQHCNHFTSWFCLNWNSFSPNYWWCFPKLYRRISGYSKSAFISLKVCFCYTQVGKKKICSRIPKFSISAFYLAHCKWDTFEGNTEVISANSICAVYVATQVFNNIRVQTVLTNCRLGEL